MTPICLLAGLSSLAPPLGWANAPEPVISLQAIGKPSDLGEPLPLRFIDVRISPLSLVSQIYGGELQFGFSSVWPRWLALGAGIDYFRNATSNNSRTTSIYEYSAVASLYFFGERFNGGWLFQPGFRYLPVNTAQRGTNTPSYNYAITATVGHEWVWQSGLNIHLAAGLASSPVQDSRTIEPLAVWQVGFAL